MEVAYPDVADEQTDVNADEDRKGDGEEDDPRLPGPEPRLGPVQDHGAHQGSRSPGNRPAGDARRGREGRGDGVSTAGSQDGGEDSQSRWTTAELRETRRETMVQAPLALSKYVYRNNRRVIDDLWRIYEICNAEK